MSSTNKPTLLILGARSDIGRAIAHRFASEGKYHLQLAARKSHTLEADVRDYKIRHGVESTLLEFDARALNSHLAFYERLLPKPAIVVCVFGFYPDNEAALQAPEILQETLETNFVGAASIIQIIANEMEERGSGIIVGISSVAGERGRAKNYLYGSAKAGFTAFLSGLRNRLHKKGVQILTVKPGFVYSSMTAGMDLPTALTAKPEQVARAVFKGVKRKKNVVYSKGIWRLIMWVIRHIPEGIFKKLDL